MQAILCRQTIILPLTMVGFLVASCGGNPQTPFIEMGSECTLQSGCNPPPRHFSKNRITILARVHHAFTLRAATWFAHETRHPQPVVEQRGEMCDKKYDVVVLGQDINGADRLACDGIRNLAVICYKIGTASSGRNASTELPISLCVKVSSIHYTRGLCDFIRWITEEDTIGKHGLLTREVPSFTPLSEAPLAALRQQALSCDYAI